MKFQGEVITKWLHHAGDDRLMELISDFSFEDSTGFVWVAPAGSRVDGASIPQFLWQAVGSPLIGDYRRASVLHDVECVLKRHPYKKVHRMFYDAMLCDGVIGHKAKYMYQAVRIFGPKWGSDGTPLNSAQTQPMGFESGILNQNIELDIESLETMLDRILGE